MPLGDLQRPRSSPATSNATSYRDRFGPDAAAHTDAQSRRQPHASMTRMHAALCPPNSNEASVPVYRSRASPTHENRQDRLQVCDGVFCGHVLEIRCELLVAPRLGLHLFFSKPRELFG